MRTAKLKLLNGIKKKMYPIGSSEPAPIEPTRDRALGKTSKRPSNTNRTSNFPRGKSNYLP